MNRAGILVAAAFAATALVPATQAGAADTAVEISTMAGDEHGKYLVGRRNLPVYVFGGDVRGGEDKAARRNCDPACQADWPPVVTEGDPTGRGEVRQELLGTIPHHENARQVTYDGWPLYYYAGGPDGADRPAGHGATGHGGEWHLVRPTGEPVDGRD